MHSSCLIKNVIKFRKQRSKEPMTEWTQNLQFVINSILTLFITQVTHKLEKFQNKIKIYFIFLKKKKKLQTISCHNKQGVLLNTLFFFNK